ncbi:Utp11 protein [Fragilaria crotonensis]|nr:Utp11 protein [Fragilaria crotonensis]
MGNIKRRCKRGKGSTDWGRCSPDYERSGFELHSNAKAKDAKKIERLQANLHHLEGTKRKHVVFVESDDAAKNFDTAQHFDTVPELAGRSFNRPRRETLEKAALQPDVNSTIRTEQELQRRAKEQRKAAKALAKERAASYLEVAERARRIAVLSRAEAHLVTEN